MVVPDSVVLWNSELIRGDDRLSAIKRWVIPLLDHAKGTIERYHAVLSGPITHNFKL